MLQQPESLSQDVESTAASPSPVSSSAYPFVFRLTHWLLTASGIVLILTGISLNSIYG